MSKEKLSTDNLPPEQKESPELWEKLVAQLKAKKWDDAESTLKKMGLSEKLVPMLSIALTEERELAETIKAGEGLEEKQRTLRTQYQQMLDLHPNSIEGLEKLGTKKGEVLKALDDNEVKLSAAHNAISKRRFVRLWLAPLFGEKQIEVEHGVATFGDTPPPRVFQESIKLNIEVYKLSSWRYVDKKREEYPRRKYITNFTPARPATTLHNS